MAGGLLIPPASPSLCWSPDRSSGTGCVLGGGPGISGQTASEGAACLHQANRRHPIVRRLYNEMRNEAFFSSCMCISILSIILPPYSNPLSLAIQEGRSSLEGEPTRGRLLLFPFSKYSENNLNAISYILMYTLCSPSCASI